MKFHVVCKLNQARSIISSAHLRNIYRDLSIDSSGIRAQSGQLIPEVIRQIALKWGLTFLDDTSRFFGENMEFSSDHQVLCADDEIWHEISRLNLPCRVVDISRYAWIDNLSPRDPLNMPSSEVEIELAKVLLATQRYVSQEVFAESGQIQAVVGDSNLGFELDLYIRNWLKKCSGIVFDMNWQVPDPEFWNLASDLKRDFDFRNISKETIQSLEGYSGIVYSRYEIDDAERILLSLGWRESLLKVAENSPILLAVRLSNQHYPSRAAEVLALLYSNDLVSV